MARYIRFFVLLGCLYGLALPFGCEPTVRVCTTNNDCLYGETCLDRLCTTAGESTTESSREMSPEPVAEWAKEPAKEPSGEPLVKDAGQGPVTPDMPREMAPEPSKAGCGSGPACGVGLVCDRQKGICVARICSPCS
jgi:hypothetical protein